MSFIIFKQLAHMDSAALVMAIKKNLMWFKQWLSEKKPKKNFHSIGKKFLGDKKRISIFYSKKKILKLLFLRKNTNVFLSKNFFAHNLNAHKYKRLLLF